MAVAAALWGCGSSADTREEDEAAGVSKQENDAVNMDEAVEDGAAAQSGDGSAESTDAAGQDGTAAQPGDDGTAHEDAGASVRLPRSLFWATAFPLFRDIIP